MDASARDGSLYAAQASLPDEMEKYVEAKKAYLELNATGADQEGAPMEENPNVRTSPAES